MGFEIIREILRIYGRADPDVKLGALGIGVLDARDGFLDLLFGDVGSGVTGFHVVDRLGRFAVAGGQRGGEGYGDQKRSVL